MIGLILIFCQVQNYTHITITGEELALVAALGTAAAVALNFIGGAFGFLGDIVVTGGAGVALVGATIVAVPAALAILLALGVALKFSIPIW